MPGIFDRTGRNRGGSDKEREKGKARKIQKKIDGLFKDFKKEFERQLRKMGLPISFLALAGADTRKRNVAIGKFTDKEGHAVTVVQSLDVYEATLPGSSPKLIPYRGETFWCTIVPGSIPFTIFFTELVMTDRFRRYPHWGELPQEPIVAAMNADEKLVDSLNRISLSTRVKISRNASLSIGRSDIGGRCVIAPAGGETVITLRAFGSYSYREMLEILSAIRKHVLAHPHMEKVRDKVPDEVFNTIYGLCKMKASEPPKEIVF